MKQKEKQETPQHLPPLALSPPSPLEFQMKQRDTAPTLPLLHPLLLLSQDVGLCSCVDNHPEKKEKRAREVIT